MDSRPGLVLVALATTRAAPICHTLAYEDSAVYFRKILNGQPRE